MSTWVCFPSKKPASECNAVLALWKARGYRTAVYRDTGDERVDAHVVFDGDYPGYAQACNGMIQRILLRDRNAEWTVCAADDIEPDTKRTAQEIAAMCTEHFGGTFGVAQPIGDPWADSSGRMIERIAGSPWIGKMFSLRAYGGNGPYFEGYFHNFVDNEIMDVAKKFGVFWQIPDVTHYHRHWGRERKQMPAYLKEVNSRAHWDKYSKMYFSRRAAGFPGCEALPLVETA